LSRSSSIVVVGASIAGTRCAEAIRRANFDGPITLVGAERHFPPVDRPPLSKGFLASADPGPVLKIDQDLDVELVLGSRAQKLALGHRSIGLDDGRTLSYDGLVIATGASPRSLGCTNGRDNVFLLRTVDDALALRTALRPGARVAVIGAGVLGCEIAATCRTMDLPVTVIDIASLPMLRLFGPLVAGLVADLHRQHGVRLLLGRGVQGLRGDRAADAVVLDDGEVVPADVVVVVIGAAPETQWLEGSGLHLADGVVCDAECFAVGGARRVVAAGDVARWTHPLFRQSMRVEHWTNAVSQAQVAGRNLVAELTGSPTVTYDVLPYFWTDQYDWKLQFLGSLGAEANFEEGQPGDQRFVVSYHTDGRLVGVLCVNRPGQVPRWRAALQAG
jgi:3-phenylpropionate/trans-cinnamate dioxygenase ferredoxin reductase component